MGQMYIEPNKTPFCLRCCVAQRKLRLLA